MTNQRITEDKPCLSLKPRKRFHIQQELNKKKGIDILYRALFTTERQPKKRNL